MSNTPRMRTRDKAIALLREIDPDTSMTRNAIDQLIRAGKLPTVKIGNKVLLNFDYLLELIAAGIDTDPEPSEQTGGIRRIGI